MGGPFSTEPTFLDRQAPLECGGSTPLSFSFGDVNLLRQTKAAGVVYAGAAGGRNRQPTFRATLPQRTDVTDAGVQNLQQALPCLERIVR
jgi:hypothetical protein